MGSETCITCAEYKRCKDSRASWIFFIIGLISTIAIRVVTVLININPLWGKVAWYIGVGGFFIFFIYKFRISQASARLVEKQNLMHKINKKEILKSDDYDLIGSILCGLTSKKERINYFFIFGLSAVALILAIYFDVVR